MRVGIFCEPHEAALGGSECCVAVLAEALRTSHDVEIVSHRTNLTIDELSRVFGAELDGVAVRHVPFRWQPYYGPAHPWRRLRETKAWLAELSAPYDLFVNFTHGLPPFCHASRGGLIILFPWFDRRKVGPVRHDGSALRSGLRRVYTDWEWKQRFDTYQTKIAISRFTRAYAKKWWGLDCEVVYPPSSSGFEVTAKSNSILSVGRFATLGHSKKQLEMVTAFNQRRCAALAEWDYYCVGGLSSLSDDIAYFESVRHQAGGRAQVLANVERDALRGLFERSKIFWHAAGLGENEQLHPQLSEHFGIVTVEAMAAGCVPIVVNKGAQSEIVEHGLSGFLWDSLDELIDYTALLACNEALRRRMSEAARVRAGLYSKQAYITELSKALCLESQLNGGR